MGREAPQKGQWKEERPQSVAAFSPSHLDRARPLLSDALLDSEHIVGAF